MGCFFSVVVCAATHAPPVGRVDDPLLVEFVERLVARHPSVAAVSAARDTAVALGEAAARPLYNPDLEFDYEDVLDETWYVGVGQQIDWAGKGRTRAMVAEAEASSAGASLDAIRNAVTGAILRDLSEYWTAVELLGLARQRSDLLADFARQATLRRAAGDLATTDENLARVSAATARLEQARAAAVLARLSRRLVTLGAPEDQSQWPAMPPSLPAISIVPADAHRLVARLPEVMAAEQQVKAAEARLELARRERRPDPSLQLRAGSEANETLLGVNVSIPLPIRNSFRAEVTAATSQVAEARARQRETRLAVTQRVLAAMETYATLYVGWLQWEQTGDLRLRQQADVLQTLWESGDVSIDDFLLRARELLELNVAVIGVRAELWSAWVEWLTAAGITGDWVSMPPPGDGDTHSDEFNDLIKGNGKGS